MRCWILNTNLEAYKHLCEDEGITPVIIEHADGKVLVNMSARMASVWNMAGYWYELG